jgi:putative Mn2+ efflux pump MntP
MSFFAIFVYTIVVACLGYMLGRSDGQVEGRIEQFQRENR